MFHVVQAWFPLTMRKRYGLDFVLRQSAVAAKKTVKNPHITNRLKNERDNNINKNKKQITTQKRKKTATHETWNKAHLMKKKTQIVCFDKREFEFESRTKRNKRKQLEFIEDRLQNNVTIAAFWMCLDEKHTIVCIWKIHCVCLLDSGGMPRKSKMKNKTLTHFWYTLRFVWWKGGALLFCCSLSLSLKHY